MSTSPVPPPPFLPPGATFPPDLYTELVAALFRPGMRMYATETKTNRYGWPVVFRDLTKEQIENRVSIARVAQTCKSMNAAVKARLDIYAHRALAFFMQTTVWASQRFARKPYENRAEMHRLWWPEDWRYPTNAVVAREVRRYIVTTSGMRKLFVVWIHRRRDKLAVQVGIHEHEGPTRVFQITDHDHDEEASYSGSDGDSIIMTDSEDGAAANADENEANQAALDAINALGTHVVVENEGVLAALDEDDSEDDSGNEIEVLTAMETVDEPDEPEEDEEEQTTGGTADEVQLYYSAAVPRWIDRERVNENVTTAMLSARVEEWIRQQHNTFFPTLVEPN
jgi:hypothetical protein